MPAGADPGAASEHAEHRLRGAGTAAGAGEIGAAGVTGWRRAAAAGLVMAHEATRIGEARVQREGIGRGQGGVAGWLGPGPAPDQGSKRADDFGCLLKFQ
jgi:hypothetical protein